MNEQEINVSGLWRRKSNGIVVRAAHLPLYGVEYISVEEIDGHPKEIGCSSLDFFLQEFEKVD